MLVGFWFPDFHIMVIGAHISSRLYDYWISLELNEVVIWDEANLLYVYALVVVINRYTYKLERLLKIRAAYAHSSVM